MSTAAIEIQDVSKHFKLYQEKYTTLKERVLHAGKIPYKEFWALRNVSTDIRSGQTVGILGRNGSGKSTLLKCIAGILQPSSGQIVVRGHLAAMLELGAGMQPELSGRDNIYLNGSLLGLSRREIDKRFDEIVAFAELEEFIDNQVKFYSSGMYIRLGFAVAVNVEPDVLLIDEVLAVGDERFQQKCMDRVKRFQREGRTIVFVSHSADLMRMICEQVIVLDHGEVLTIAPPGEAIRRFRESLLESGTPVEELAAIINEEPGAGLAQPVPPRRSFKINSCEVLPEQEGRTHLLPGEPLSIRVSFDVARPMADVVFGIAIYARNGTCVFMADTEAVGQCFDLVPGRGNLLFHFDSVPLLDGTYAVNVRAQDSEGGAVHDVLEEGCRFEVMSPGKQTGLVALELEATLQMDTDVSDSVPVVPLPIEGAFTQ